MDDDNGIESDLDTVSNVVSVIMVTGIVCDKISRLFSLSQILLEMILF
jgi:hypothetical protein